jgi:type I restriction enzyme R subunit
MSQQANKGRAFTPEQVHWLEMIRDHVATSLEFSADDFDLTPFAEEGGLGRAQSVFGRELGKLIPEVTAALVA